MPDSQQPPPWGPAYDERDLDALLSGQTWSTPAALRPVESTLAALRAPSTRRELANEASARTAFRAYGPAWPAAAPAPIGEHAGVTAHTLILPAADSRTQPPARHRHRHRRRAVASGRRRPGLALTSATAAALIVVAAVITSALTGSIGELTSFGRKPASASASALATGDAPGSQGLLATGAARDRSAPQSSRPKQTSPVVAPSSPHPTPDPPALCRQYFTYLMHPTAGGRTAWVNLRGELGKLAGSPTKIDLYCLRYLVSPLGVKDGWPAFSTSPGAANANANANANGAAGANANANGAASANANGAAGASGAAGSGGGANPADAGAGGGGQPSAGGSATQQGQSNDPGAAGRP